MSWGGYLVFKHKASTNPLLFVYFALAEEREEIDVMCNLTDVPIVPEWLTKPVDCHDDNTTEPGAFWFDRKLDWTYNPHMVHCLVIGIVPDPVVVRAYFGKSCQIGVALLGNPLRARIYGAKCVLTEAHLRGDDWLFAPESPGYLFLFMGYFEGFMAYEVFKFAIYCFIGLWLYLVGGIVYRAITRLWGRITRRHRARGIGQFNANGCAICMVLFVLPAPHGTLYHFPACGHVFHFVCIQTYFATQAAQNLPGNCPVCRAAHLAMAMPVPNLGVNTGALAVRNDEVRRTIAARVDVEWFAAWRQAGPRAVTASLQRSVGGVAAQYNIGADEVVEIMAGRRQPAQTALLALMREVGVAEDDFDDAFGAGWHRIGLFFRGVYRLLGAPMFEGWADEASRCFRLALLPSAVPPALREFRNG
jgi:hypothetical protein